MSTPTEQYSTRLQPKQIAILLAVGAFFWYVAAVIVRIIAPMGAFEGAMWFATYAAVIPLTAVFIGVAWKLAGLRRETVLAGAAVATGIATALDATALSWFRSLYGTNDTDVLAGAAYILWGVCVVLAMAAAMHESRND